MELKHYALLLWHWLWLILLGVALAAAASYVVSKRTTPVYAASTKMLISPSKAQVMDSLSFQPEIERLAGTYAEMMRGRPVYDEVVRNLSLPEGASWSASVGPIRNTQLLVLSVQDTDPRRAAAIANEIPKVFTRQNYELQARRYADSKASLQQQIDETQSSIADSQERLRAVEASASPDQDVLDRDRRELQTLEGSYAILTASYEELRLEEAKQLDTLLVTEEATPPLSPIRPKTRQNVLLAAMLGALVASAFAFSIDYFSDVLKDPQLVDAGLGLTTLAAVPVAQGAANVSELGMIAGGQSPIAEAYRVLRTNLPFAAVDRPLRTLLVTSSLPAEGKSMTSANLAMALAQGGRRVILVDCDLHRPAQHKLMKLQNNVGLTTVLIDEGGDLTRLLQDGPAPGLRVLTSGPLPPNPAEVLGSARMRLLLADLADEADIIVVDSPPVLAVADSAILASQVDGVLMVIDARRTRRELAARALGSLQQVQARVVGAVLNRVQPWGASYPYYAYFYDSGKADTVGGAWQWPWQKNAGRRAAAQPAGGSLVEPAGVRSDG